MEFKLKNLFVMFLVMLVLVGAMTAIMTWANLLPAQAFLHVWLSSFLFTFIVLIPSGALIFIVLNKFIQRCFSTWSELKKNLLQGILMAILMESIMAVVLTAKSGSYDSLVHFSQLVLNSLLYALPVGLVLSLAMTLVIKPRLTRYLTSEPA